MAGVNKTRIGNDDIYEATAVVDGGLLVVPAAGATNAGVQGIAVAGDGADNCLGVAARRAEPLANQNLTGTDGDNYPLTYANPVNELTAVYKNCVLDVTYTAAAVGFGAKLASAAGGHVRAWVAADGPESIVGECRVVGGMGAGGGTGKALIY